MDGSADTPQGKVDLLLLHRRNLGFASEADHVHWAVDTMVAGLDSRGLRFLAGLVPPYDPVEVRDYFWQAMEELGIEHPGSEESLDLYGELIARGILAGRIDPEYGMLELSRTMPEEGFYSVWYWLDEFKDLPGWVLVPVDHNKLSKDATLEDVIRQVATQFLEDLERHRSG